MLTYDIMKSFCSFSFRFRSRTCISSPFCINAWQWQRNLPFWITSQQQKHIMNAPKTLHLSRNISMLANEPANISLHHTQQPHTTNSLCTFITYGALFLKSRTIIAWLLYDYFILITILLFTVWSLFLIFNLTELYSIYAERNWILGSYGRTYLVKMGILLLLRIQLSSNSHGK